MKSFGVSALPIQGNDRLSPAARLDIYANMYFYRIRDSLKEDFPAVLKCLGETGFHNLITSYLAKNPPTHFSLRYAGQYLPRFIRNSKEVQKYPFLAELARFEWDLLTSFDAVDNPPLVIEELKKIAPDQWSQLVFNLSPSLIVRKYKWPVDQIHSRLLAGKKIKVPEKKPIVFCIWRQNYRVHHRPLIDRLEQKSLILLQKGKSFGDMCQTAAKNIGIDQAPSAMASLLSRWVHHHWLVSF